MRFKLWLQMIENLAGGGGGPGGGPGPEPDDQVALNRNIMRQGAGAFPSGGDNPRTSRKTPTARYEDSRFSRKTMKKK